jgi:hypothetical protein
MVGATASTARAAACTKTFQRRWHWRKRLHTKRIGMLCFHKPHSRILHLDDNRALPHAPAEHLRLSHGSALFFLSQVQMGASVFEEDEFRKLSQHKRACPQLPSSNPPPLLRPTCTPLMTTRRQGGVEAAATGGPHSQFLVLILVHTHPIFFLNNLNESSSIIHNQKSVPRFEFAATKRD